MTAQHTETLLAQDDSDPARRRRRIAAGIVGVLVACMLAFGAGHAEGRTSAPVPTSDAERTVADLAGDDPLSALRDLPADFSTVIGYQPVVQDGLPVNPHGSCSSPVPLPARFEPLCRAHDFGYDLLRYAVRTGRAAAPWAREALDAMLVQRMHDSCTNPLCSAAATLSRTGLAMNTWREHSGPPTSGEPLTRIAATYVTRGAEALGAGR